MLDGVRILAVHHDAGRSGATLLFQSVLEGLVNAHGAVVSTSVPREGPIVERARALGPVHVHGDSRAPRSRVARVARRLRPPGPPSEATNVDIVFANSTVSPGIVEDLLAGSAAPLVLYVHESRYLLQSAPHFAARKQLLCRADLIFSVSARVSATLAELIEPSARVVVATPFIPVRPTGHGSGELPPAARPGSQIIGTIGTMNWHKGVDLFAVVARRTKQLLPDHDLRFIWIGGEQRPEIRQQVEHDVAIAELEDIVFFPGEMDDPTAFLSSLSLLLLPSREDSWPLVMLEAAAEGVPMVCFQNAGGAEQFLATGGGTAVPYLDTEAMAQAIVRYLSDADLMTRDERMARENAARVTADDQIRTIATELEKLHASRLEK